VFAELYSPLSQEMFRQKSGVNIPDGDKRNAVPSDATAPESRSKVNHADDVDSLNVLSHLSDGNLGMAIWQRIVEHISLACLVVIVSLQSLAVLLGGRVIRSFFMGTPSTTTRL
jgi:hypothetical protein